MRQMRHEAQVKGLTGQAPRPLYRRFLIPRFMRRVYQDHEQQEQLVRNSAPQWGIVRPAVLTNDTRSGTSGSN